jgi:signal peptidase II
MTADPTRRNLLVASALGAIVLLADKLSKDWVWEHLRSSAPVRLIPGWAHFDFAFNTGSAFGLGSSLPWARELFASLALLVVVGLFVMLGRVRPKNPLAATGVGLSAGGAAGNMLDRLTRVFDERFYGVKDLQFNDLIEHAPIVAESIKTGHFWMELPRQGVVDFIVIFYAPHRRWPAFNLADVALSIGALCLIIWVWREEEEVFGAEPARETAAKAEIDALPTQGSTPTWE